MDDFSTPSWNVLLAPTGSWHRIATDESLDVWLTSTSSLEIERFEPAVRLRESVFPETLTQALRQSDHAAFVVHDRRKGTVTVECGPRSGDRLYVIRRNERLEITAGLEHMTARVRSTPLSSRFVAIWLANALSFGGFDLFLGTSPFEGTCLVARGLRAEFALNSETAVISLLQPQLQSSSRGIRDRYEAIDNCRTALHDAIMTATVDSNVVAECSGGIDSGLTAVSASRVVRDRYLGGIFADYPYYEFAQERKYAQSIADKAGFTLHFSDPRLWMCWGGRKHPLGSRISPEPSLHMPFWGQSLAACDVAWKDRRIVVLTGQGGDRLFQTHDRPFVMAQTRPTWIPPKIWDIICRETEQIREWLEAPGQICAGYGLDNPWASRALMRVRPGAIHYSPLSSRRVVDAVMQLRNISGEYLDGSDPARKLQKPLAHIAFADLLPDSIWARRWKVNYVGLYYRFWIKEGGAFIALAKRMSPYLEAVGFQPRSVVERVASMAEGHKSSDRLLNALITYLFWLDKFIRMES